MAKREFSAVFFFLCLLICSVFPCSHVCDLFFVPGFSFALVLYVRYVVSLKVFTCLHLYVQLTLTYLKEKTIHNLHGNTLLESRSHTVQYNVLHAFSSLYTNTHTHTHLELKRWNAYVMNSKDGCMREKKTRFFLFHSFWLWIKNHSIRLWCFARVLKIMQYKCMRDLFISCLFYSAERTRTHTHNTLYSI